MLLEMMVVDMLQQISLRVSHGVLQLSQKCRRTCLQRPTTILSELAVRNGVSEIRVHIQVYDEDSPLGETSVQSEIQVKQY